MNEQVIKDVISLKENIKKHEEAINFVDEEMVTERNAYQAITDKHEEAMDKYKKDLYELEYMQGRLTDELNERMLKWVYKDD